MNLTAAAREWAAALLVSTRDKVMHILAATIRDELEHRHRLALREIHGLVERAFAEFLHDIGRELDGCRSLTQVRELFRPEIHAGRCKGAGSA